MYIAHRRSVIGTHDFHVLNTPYDGGDTVQTNLDKRLEETKEHD